MSNQRLQFGLKQLLVVTAVIGCLIGFHRILDAEHQRLLNIMMIVTAVPVLVGYGITGLAEHSMAKRREAGEPSPSAPKRITLRQVRSVIGIACYAAAVFPLILGSMFALLWAVGEIGLNRSDGIWLPGVVGALGGAVALFSLTGFLLRR